MKSIILVTLLLCLRAQDPQLITLCDDQQFYRPDPMYVSGTAAYAVPPELAIINMGLDVLKQTASDALQESADIMSKAITAILALGVTKDEIATSSLTVNEQYDSIWDQANSQYNQIFRGFQVTQSLTITTKLVDQAGAVIDAGVSNGMNRVDDVSFDAKDSTKATIKDNLIQAAIADAKTKANIALQPLGYQIGLVKDISIDDFSFGQPDATSNYEQYKAAVPATTSVFSETQVISVSVSISYLISKILSP